MPPIIDTIWDAFQQLIETVGMIGASALVMVVGVASLFFRQWRH
jgi:hypothetical protein